MPLFLGQLVPFPRWLQVIYGFLLLLEQGLCCTKKLPGARPVVSQLVWFKVFNFSPNSLLWGTLLEKKAGRDMLWPRSWSLSATCPPFVRLVSAVATPPNLVHHASTLCPPRRSKPCPPCVVCLGRASKPCPPCVRFVSVRLWPCPTAGARRLVRLMFVHLRSALAAPGPPNLVRPVPALCLL